MRVFLGYRNAAQNTSSLYYSTRIADLRHTLVRTRFIYNVRFPTNVALGPGARAERYTTTGKIRPDTSTCTLRSPRNAGDHTSLSRQSVRRNLACTFPDLRLSFGACKKHRECKTQRRPIDATVLVVVSIAFCEETEWAFDPWGCTSKTS